MHPIKILLICFISLSIAGLSAYIGPRKVYTVEEMKALHVSNLYSIDQISVGKNSKTAKFWSDSIQNGSIVLAIAAALGFYFRKKQQLLRSLLFVGLTLSLNVAGINLAKNLIARPRPWMYLESFQEKGVVKYTDMLSHFSGHTCTAFAMLSAFFILTIPFLRKEEKILLGSFLFIIASTCGWLRIEAGYHYFTDVIHGAVWGIVFSLIAAKITFRDKNAEKNQSTNA